MTRAILYALQLVLVFAPPALIAFFASRRWRLRGVVIWALAPLVILLVVAGRELSTGKTSPADLDNLIFGILLIGSFLLLPWLMACAAGYAIGAMLRRRRRPDPRPPARPRPALQLQSQPPRRRRPSPPPSPMKRWSRRAARASLHPAAGRRPMSASRTTAASSTACRSGR